jgi:hypothetical protein
MKALRKLLLSVLRSRALGMRNHSNQHALPAVSQKLS